MSALWPEAERFLATTPELEAKALFEHLIGQLGPDAAELSARALRTIQRRVQTGLKSRTINKASPKQTGDIE